ncbi:acid protease [Aureobasidium sp. EXF-12298]|nr:acid protease [Aureobasidium sp. EXF-12298]KAI4772441.1 acid protease [Aureobasidium sp. EXF-3400]
MQFLMRFFISLSLLFCYARAAASRPKTVELALMSSVGNTEGLEYFVNLTVGTPGQPQTLIVDTGSSNTFLFASDVSLLASNASFCNTSDCVGGTFDSSKSSTFEMIDPEAFKVNFMLGTEWFRGDYVRDAVQINDLIVQKLTFGLATKLKERFKPYTGIMGLGYPSNILHRKHHKMATPPTFVEGLVQSGAISSRLYSIYLNTLDQYGSILFGGVDTKKYKGQLTTLNLLRSRHKVDNIDLYLEEVKIKPYNESEQTIVRSTNDKKFTTLIDTGTPDWQLPIDAYLEVVRYAGSEPSTGFWPGVPKACHVKACSEVARGIANTTHFEVTFAGNGSNTAVLRLELADLFSQITTQDGSAATDASGRPMCWLRVVPQYGTDLITSSSVIRAGYWVFDLDNGQVSLAQANLGANSSDVVPVEAGADGLEKAVNNDLRAEAQLDKVEGRLSTSVTYVLSTATNTVGYATGAESYPTPTGTGMYDPSGDHSPPRSSNGHVRRFESAATATMVNLGASGMWVLCVAVVMMAATLVV